MEALGPQLRRRRRRLGLTLDDLAGKTGISKPYLSLIETGRVPNPPSDEKLRRLEQALDFVAGELLTQAHIQRTPRDVRAMLQKLLQKGSGIASDASADSPRTPQANGKTLASASLPASASLNPLSSKPIDLDDAYLSGVLQEMVERSAGNVEQVGTRPVPVINRVSAGYPKDFTDLAYPPRVADDYVGCPDVHDRDAFAARVSGDSMTPKYRPGDIVIFSPSADPRNGDDCFVRFDDGQTTFKRVFFEKGEKREDSIRLQPRNEKYPPQVVPSQKISGLYKAVFKYQRVDED